MKTKLFLIVSCLFFFPVTGYTQPNKPALDEWEQAALQRSRDLIRFGRLRHWDSLTSNAIVPHVLVFPEFRHAIGMSDAQYQQIKEKIHETSIESLHKKEDALRAIYERAGVSVRPKEQGWMGMGMVIGSTENLSDKDREDLRYITEDRWESEIAFSDVVGGELTPEQHQKINEALLANMGREMMLVISPSRFEGLNLTDAQREQMRILERELKPKLDIFLDNYIDSRIAYQNRLHSLIQEQKGETLREKTQETNKIIIDDAEFNGHFAAMLAHERAFTTLVVKEIGDRNILTKEQWARLQELFDDPPEHAKILAMQVLVRSSDPNKVNEMNAVNKGSEESEKAGWQPGPGSWKPGDAIPEQYRQDRNERNRFPRGAE